MINETTAKNGIVKLLSTSSNSSSSSSSSSSSLENNELADAQMLVWDNVLLIAEDKTKNPELREQKLTLISHAFSKLEKPEQKKLLILTNHVEKTLGRVLYDLVSQTVVCRAVHATTLPRQRDHTAATTLPCFQATKVIALFLYSL